MIALTVLGASGFLGQAVLRAASTRRIPTRAVSRASLGGELPGVAQLRVTSYFDMPRARGNDEVLLHLAQSNVIRGEQDATAVDLVEHLLTMGYRHVCFGSSAAVYGDRDDHAHRSDEVVTPATPYAELKRRCEKLIVEQGGSAARLTNLYGPGQSEASVLHRVLSQIPGTGPMTLRTLAPVRDFCWVDDAAEAVLSWCATGASGVFNVGMGSSVSIGELARLALEVAHEEHRELRAEEATPVSSVLRVDVSATTSVCGWRPRTDLRSGLTQLIGNRT